MQTVRCWTVVQMDEMLTGAQEGAIKAMQLKDSQQQLQSNDRLYVQVCCQVIRVITFSTTSIRHSMVCMLYSLMFKLGNPV